MENTKDIGKIQNLTELGELLKGIDLSAFKMVDKINAKITELKKEFNDFLQDHEFISIYDLHDYNYDKIAKDSLNLEHSLYKEVFDAVTEYRDYDEIEALVDFLKEIRREYYSTRRQIRLLEELLAWQWANIVILYL